MRQTVRQGRYCICYESYILGDVAIGSCSGLLWKEVSREELYPFLGDSWRHRLRLWFKRLGKFI